ncbi:MAG: cyclodeaminase [Gammaproteobacteria bacterium]
MNITVLTEKELRECVSLDVEAIAAMEPAFTALASGDADMPPIMRVDVPEHNGEVDIKTAYIRGLDSFALKASGGFFDNHKLGLPSLSGLMVLLSAQTGYVQAILLDNGYLTDVRTAAAGALAAQHLAPESCVNVGVLGAGAQARLQIQALKLVRDFRRVRVWARNRERAEAYRDEMSAALGVDVEVCAEQQEVVRRSDTVVTTTPATKSLIDADWLHPGLHITAMGSDAETKNELAPAVIARADLFVCDSRAQSARLGELHHAIAAGAVGEDVAVTELGEITNGGKPGRESADQITVCDLTGTGVQDTAIARLAYRKAIEAGFGLQVES